MKKRVKAAKGKRVVFPKSIMAAPGGLNSILEGDTVVTTDVTQRFVQKRIEAGDLVELGDDDPGASDDSPMKIPTFDDENQENEGG